MSWGWSKKDYKKYCDFLIAERNRGLLYLMGGPEKDVFSDIQFYKTIIPDIEKLLAKSNIKDLETSLRIIVNDWKNNVAMKKCKKFMDSLPESEAKKLKEKTKSSSPTKTFEKIKVPSLPKISRMSSLSLDSDIKDLMKGGQMKKKSVKKRRTAKKIF